MDPVVAATTSTATGDVHFLNIQYLFFVLYQWLTGAHGVSGGVNVSWIVPLLTTIWVTVSIVGSLLAIAFLALFVYSTIRLHQLEDEESLKYTTLADAHAAEEVTEHHRWTHVRELIESADSNDWRQAIIEADIILDDMLNRLGYQGASVGEKLKAADPSKFHTLNDAWDAHKVRNDIAHKGSAFELTDHLAYRTILQYENVFKEHGEI